MTTGRGGYFGGSFPPWQRPCANRAAVKGKQSFTDSQDIAATAGCSLRLTRTAG